MEGDPARLAAEVASFAATGVLTTVQQVIGTALSEIPGGDPDLVAEETLSLVSSLTGRALGQALTDRPELEAILIPVAREFPASYYDYLIGTSIVADGDAAAAEESGRVYERLQRKRSYYEGVVGDQKASLEQVTRRALRDWLNRVSPPSAPGMPGLDLQASNVLRTMEVHLKLVQAYVRRLLTSP